jgi:hypothetical protein
MSFVPQVTPSVRRLARLGVSTVVRGVHSRAREWAPRSRPLP